MTFLSAPDLRSCHGCVRFDAGGYEPENGYTAPTTCDAAYELHANGDASEAVSVMFQDILFQLSALNNCPLRKEPRPRSLRDVAAAHRARQAAAQEVQA